VLDPDGYNIEAVCHTPWFVGERDANPADRSRTSGRRRDQQLQRLRHGHGRRRSRRARCLAPAGVFPTAHPTATRKSEHEVVLAGVVDA